MRTPSTTPKAIAARLRRLHDPKWAEAQNAARRRYYAAKRVRGINDMANRNASFTPSRQWRPSRVMEDRVRYHLSRGRDAGEIAIRDGIKVSIAKRIVDHVRAVQAADTAQHSLAPGNGGRA